MDNFYILSGILIENVL